MPDTGTAPNKTYTRSDGERTGTGVCVAERTAGDNNTAELCDARENDMATALSNRWMRDGGNKPSANIPMGGFKLTGAGDAADPQDYMCFGQFFDAGTAMLFAQTAAPTGWTKSTANNDAALRVVSGAASSGGSVAFSVAFASQAVTGAVADHTLTEDEIPSHNHDLTDPGHTHTYLKAAADTGAGIGLFGTGSHFIGAVSDDTGSTETGITLGDAGGGLAHGHGWTGDAINLEVAYVDCIIATRD